MIFKLYAVLVANSILIYDHIATITDEITFIWCRPKALSATLFLVNRYFALLGNVYMLSAYILPISNESCGAYLVYRELLFFSQQIFVCLILTLRTYALYCRSKRLLAWMMIIGFVLGGVTTGTLGLRKNAVVLGFNCFESHVEETAVS
jgi:hypothetical protein